MLMEQNNLGGIEKSQKLLQEPTHPKSLLFLILYGVGSMVMGVGNIAVVTVLLPIHIASLTQSNQTSYLFPDHRDRSCGCCPDKSSGREAQRSDNFTVRQASTMAHRGWCTHYRCPFAASNDSITSCYHSRMDLVADWG